MNPLSRAAARRKYRTLRRELSVQQQRSHADAVGRHFACARLMLCFNRFAVYAAADGEIDASPIAEQLLAAQKTVALPVVQRNRQLAFSRYTPDTPIRINRYRIAEPDPRGATPVAAASLDVVLLPLVAFDALGHRLGMGGGYYDASFAARPRALRIGLAHAVQFSASLPARDWDVPLDAVLTERGGFSFTARARRFFPQHAQVH
jgi:5-formyltetrahydrofolate cyclo-ligase